MSGSGRRRRRARQRRSGPRPCDLVLAAAEVAGTDPDSVLDGADVEVLVGICGRAAALADEVAAASEVLVGIAAGRPFARANSAAAWLAAMQLLAERDRTVIVDDEVAIDLVRRARDGRLVERDVAERLRPFVVVPAGPVRRIGRTLVQAALTARPVPVRRCVCPVCDRTVGDAGRWPLTPHLPVDDCVVVAVCAHQHGLHDGRGRPHRRAVTPEPPRWCPIVLESPGGLDDSGSPGSPFVALTDDGPVAFLPTDDRSRPELEVVLVDELAASDLVGSWDRDRLCARGVVIARVPSSACRLDESGSAVDWHAVMAATEPGSALVPA